MKSSAVCTFSNLCRAYPDHAATPGARVVIERHQARGATLRAEDAARKAAQAKAGRSTVEARQLAAAARRGRQKPVEEIRPAKTRERAARGAWARGG
jgi:hypothetical protein